MQATLASVDSMMPRRAACIPDVGPRWEISPGRSVVAKAPAPLRCHLVASDDDGGEPGLGPLGVLATRVERALSTLRDTLALLHHLARGGQLGATAQSSGTAARPERLVFTSRWERRRCWIVLDGVAVALTPMEFVRLVILAMLRQDGPGWGHRLDLGASAEYDGWNGMSRIEKRICEQFGEGARGLFENDRGSQYRIGLRPDQIELDRDAIFAHPCRAVREALQRWRHTGKL